jgi:plasmid replication initiation protein
VQPAISTLSPIADNPESIKRAQRTRSAKSTALIKPLLPENYVELIERAERTNSITKHNLLVETPTTKTLLEAKIFALMLRSIRKGESEPTTAVILLKDLFPTGNFGGKQRRLLEEAMERLVTASIRISKLNSKESHLVSLCGRIGFDSEKRLLLASFGQQVLPYLVNLVGNFTIGDINELRLIKSDSTHKLYWLMRSWQFKSTYTVTVEKLKALTTGNRYDQYADYRSKGLDPSVAELNELSFDITYTERREGGQVVTGITFNIGHKEKHRQAVSLPVAENPAPTNSLSPMQQKVQTRLQKLKLTEVQIRKVLQVLGNEEVPLTKLLMETFPILRDFETKAKPGENVAASTMILLKSTFPAIWAAERPSGQSPNHLVSNAYVTLLKAAILARPPPRLLMPVLFTRRDALACVVSAPQPRQVG